MSSRPNAPSAWVPELVRTPAAARPANEAESASAGAPGERDALRDRMSRLDWAIVLAGAAWVVVFVLVRWPAPLRAQVDSNSNIDAAFFALAGRLVRDGAAPYLSFWDHKPPLIYLIDAAALTLSGGAIWGVWLATLAALLLTLGTGAAATWRLAGATGAVVGATWFAFSIGLVAPFNLTEGFVLPIQAAAMLLVARWSHARGPVLASALAVGVLAGLAFLLRPNLIGAPAAAALTMGLTLVMAKRWRDLLPLLVGLAVGAAAAVAPVLLWLGSAGALPAFWDQVFHYNFVYSSASWRARVRTAFEGSALATAYGTLLLPLAGWIVAGARLRSMRGRVDCAPPLLLGVLWVPVELALAAVPGRTYAHYFAPLLLPLAYLAGLFASEAIAALRRAGSLAPSRAWRSGATAVLCGAIAIVPVGRTLFEVRDAGLRGDRAEQVARTAQYVRAHSAPTDPLLVWGHASDVYLFSDRNPASRFVYALPLLTPGYADSALVLAFLDELRASTPPLVVDATPNAPFAERLVPPLAAWNPSWRYPDAGVAWWTMTPALRRFYDYIKANYAIADTVGPKRWVMYRRVTASPER